MPKKSDKPQNEKITMRQPLGRVSEEDFQEHVWGRKARRRMKVRRWVKFAATSVVMLAVLAMGFVATETLLRVSEMPPEALARTQPRESAAPEDVTRPAPEGPPLRSFYVPLKMLDRNDDSPMLVAQAKELEATAAVITFKDGGGYLSYPSNLMQQGRVNASQKMRYRTYWTMRDLQDKAGQRVVGVIHCFDDPLAAGAMPEASVLRRGTLDSPWTDGQGRRWLNPYAPQAREYLLAVIREAAALGADEILLCGVSFPGGNLQGAVFPGQEEIDTDAADAAVKLAKARNEALRGFIAEAKEAAGEAPLYVMIPGQAALDGAPELGGGIWGCAADYIAVDTRGAPWAGDENYWRTRPVLPVVETPEDAQGARDYIVLVDEISDIQRSAAVRTSAGEAAEE
ncbi:MAG: putative glycoside hydrolase [Firmicutes bacterium]|nr:putative glycoside hydrolase [Bacillota bacterium]